MRKVFALIGVILTIAGVAICSVSMMALGFDYKKFNVTEYVTNKYPVEDSFTNISVKGNTEDIIFAASEDGTCHVVCHEEEEYPHYVHVEGDTLIIDSREDIRKWHFGINFGDHQYIKLYLPEKEYGALQVDENTGDVIISEGFIFESMHIELNTGDVRFEGCDAGTIFVETNTGSVTGTLLTDKVFSTDTNLGDIDVPESTTGGKCRITTTTGDIRISIP
ncbi:MAG: DUF4097 domain-containing protein [Lachnospiraceae bacterium]|nr:DUF4097 domain-containing protein [Lachnospiraceae bacterium]